MESTEIEQDDAKELIGNKNSSNLEKSTWWGGRY